MKNVLTVYRIHDSIYVYNVHHIDYIRKLISIRYILFMNDAYHLQAFHLKMLLMVIQLDIFY